MRLTVSRRLTHRPVCADPRLFVGSVQLQHTARIELVDVFIYGIRRRNISMDEIQLKHLCVDRIVKTVQHAEAADIRGKREVPVHKPIIQRFLADPVPDERQLPCLPVKERDGKHSLAVPDRLRHTVCLDRLDQHLGVGCPAKSRNLLLSQQLVPESAVIVDLPVEHADIPAGCRVHRLCAGLRQIHDRQSAMPEHHVGIFIRPDIPGIRTPVIHPLVHPLYIFSPVRRTAAKTCYSTHTFNPIPVPV